MWQRELIGSTASAKPEPFTFRREQLESVSAVGISAVGFYLSTRDCIWLHQRARKTKTFAPHLEVEPRLKFEINKVFCCVETLNASRSGVTENIRAPLQSQLSGFKLDPTYLAPLYPPIRYKALYLTAVPLGLGSNPGEGVDVCKRKVPVRQGDTKYSSNRKSSREISGRGREVGGPDQGVLPENWGVTEPNRTVPCIILKATANDRRRSSPL
ncbi:hypothetical protein TNCV_398011 [Trichonephila clavipes]|nr:hypothetical protein TNCV_398011 [Trichonephila clavipes]